MLSRSGFLAIDWSCKDGRESYKARAGTFTVSIKSISTLDLSRSIGDYRQAPARYRELPDR